MLLLILGKSAFTGSVNQIHCTSLFAHTCCFHYSTGLIRDSSLKLRWTQTGMASETCKVTMISWKLTGTEAKRSDRVKNGTRLCAYTKDLDVLYLACK